jgi:hypothetical protein
VDLFAQAPFRTDAEAIADQPHPDHQLGGDRGPPDSAVGGRQLRLQPSNSTNLSIDRIDDWRNVPPSGPASCGFLRFGAMDHLAVRRVDRNTHN